MTFGLATLAFKLLGFGITLLLWGLGLALRNSGEPVSAPHGFVA